MHLGKRSTLLALPLAAAAVGIGVVPAFSAGRTHARPAIVSHVASISATARAGSAAAPVDHVTIYMFRKKSLLPGTPDGKFHDEAVPSTWAVRAGVWTEVTMINYDDGPHSLTIPQLGLDEIAQGGIKTTTPFAGETQWETLNLAVPHRHDVRLQGAEGGIVRVVLQDSLRRWRRRCQLRDDAREQLRHDRFHRRRLSTEGEKACTSGNEPFCSRWP